MEINRNEPNTEHIKSYDSNEDILYALTKVGCTVDCRGGQKCNDALDLR